jgi:hypothetical protein
VRVGPDNARCGASTGGSSARTGTSASSSAAVLRSKHQQSSASSSSSGNKAGALHRWGLGTVVSEADGTGTGPTRVIKV